MALADDVIVHRVGGAALANLCLKPVEERLMPPGLSLQVGGTPCEAADRIRAVYRSSRTWSAALEVGTATVGAIRTVGFDVMADPTSNFPLHARLIHPQGVAGFTDANPSLLATAFVTTEDCRNDSDCNHH